MNKIIDKKKSTFNMLITILIINMLISIFLFFNDTKYVLYLNSKHRNNISDINSRMYYFMDSNKNIYKITYNKSTLFVVNSWLNYYYFLDSYKSKYDIEEGTIDANILKYVISNGVNLEHFALGLGILSLCGMTICFYFKKK